LKIEEIMPETDHASRLESLCRQWGCSLFGVADLRIIPKEQILLSSRVLDQHPHAISVGYHLSDAILDDLEDKPTPLYFQHYQRVNILLDTLGLILTHAIQELGYGSLAIPASQLVDWETQRGHLSHKHIAQAAGIGWIGRNNLLVSKRYGARVRLLTVLTNLPLRSDSPLSEGCGSCRACMSVCPAGAIKEERKDFDHVRCYDQLKTFSKTLRFSHHICGVCVRACRGKT
jgi:epoxyqueuosine reductase QueG